MKKTAMNGWTRCSLFTGLTLSLMGILLLEFWPMLIDHVLQKELRIFPGSKRIEHWVETPVPMYIDIYFFNWTNPQQIDNKKFKPSFVEMGPYRFYEKRTKVGLTWNGNKTITFRQIRHWYFDPVNSKGSLKDEVTTVNLVPLVATRLYRNVHYYEKIAFSIGLDALRQQVMMRKTVEQLLFKGYSDELLKFAKKFPLLSKEKVETDRFGWFYKRNGSDELDGVFNMETGDGDITKVGQLISWNNKNSTGYFEGNCGEVGGSTGEVFPPGITPNDKIGLFSPDLCRTIYLDYDKPETISGIEGFRFRGGVDLVDSGKYRKENECFCPSGDCPPTGLLNLTRCRRGAPLFLSYPHFYMGDPQLLESVDGLEPDKEKHEFHFTVEPNFGIPIDLVGRFQLNLMLQSDPDIRLYRQVPKRIYMPVMWFDQRASLTEPLSREIGLMLAIPCLGKWGALALLSIGLGISLLAVLLSMGKFAKREAPRKGRIPNVPLTRRQTEEPLIP